MFVFLVACSSDGGDEKSSDGEVARNDSGQSGMNVEQQEMNSGEEADMATEESAEMEQADTTESSEQKSLSTGEQRKIIYHANLYLESENFDETIDFLENETKKYQGYVVSSNYSNHEKNEQRFGSITIRVPSDNFYEFIALVEDGNLKVLDKSVSGEDVTEQFVDLSSRLKSKKVVEERLLSFMEEAEKTEDLLKISNDLADVQEEIEQLTGKINYLENQSDFATITMELVERRVDIPSVQDESLNTWEKTKDQFLTSIQTIFSIASGLFIFLIGNAPILILVTVVAVIIYIIFKRKLPRKES